MLGLGGPSLLGCRTYGTVVSCNPGAWRDALEKSLSKALQPEFFLRCAVSSDSPSTLLLFCPFFPLRGSGSCCQLALGLPSFVILYYPVLCFGDLEDGWLGNGGLGRIEVVGGGSCHGSGWLGCLV